MCLNQSPANENIWWITGPVICLRILFFLQKNNGKINRFNKVIKPHKIIILTAEITQTEKKTLSSNQLQNKILIFALGHLEPCSLRLALLWISCSFLRIHNIPWHIYIHIKRRWVCDINPEVWLCRTFRPIVMETRRWKDHKTQYIKNWNFMMSLKSKYSRI